MLQVSSEASDRACVRTLQSRARVKRKLAGARAGRGRLRAEGGNLLIVSVLVLFIIILMVLGGFALQLLKVSHKREQMLSDSLVLSAARALNEGDRAGQLNNLVAMSRQLVFDSRQAHEKAREHYRHLEPLARQLLEEARSGARLVEGDRQGLVLKLLNDARRAVKSWPSEAAPQMAMPGMKTSAPQVVSLDAGYVEGVPSNVEIAGLCPELVKKDRGAGYVHEASGLYRGNIDALLPSPDNDLTFKLSSLPAPVDGSVAPARLITAKVFKGTAALIKDGQDQRPLCDQLPSAVRLDLLMSIQTGSRGEDHHELKVGASGAASGANPPPG